MSRPATVEPAAGRSLTPLSADEKNIVAALFSWMKNPPRRAAGRVRYGVPAGQTA
jgi:hypothetical protein